MAKTGRKVVFHGAFASKTDAKRKEKRVRGFIKKIRVKGQTRYAVMTGKR